jgi:hypothetical protein
MKLFPARQAGGTELLKALAGHSRTCCSDKCKERLRTNCLPSQENSRRKFHLDFREPEIPALKHGKSRAG